MTGEGARSVVVGLGANVGDRLGNIVEAVDRLDKAPNVRVIAVSKVYETEPLGLPQPKYLNAAARLAVRVPLVDLLAIVRSIEDALGRVRTEHWGPRTLDIDILWAEGEAVRGPDLVVPHPGLLDRAFALAPLMDVLSPVPLGFCERLEALGGAPPHVVDALPLPK